jgi:hypothetical protein
VRVKILMLACPIVPISSLIHVPFRHITLKKWFVGGGVLVEHFHAPPTTTTIWMIRIEDTYLTIFFSAFRSKANPWLLLTPFSTPFLGFLVNIISFIYNFGLITGQTTKSTGEGGWLLTFPLRNLTIFTSSTFQTFHLCIFAS